MQTISKVLVCVALACTFLSWAAFVHRQLPRTASHHRTSRERPRIFARLRRCRGDNPVHHPVRPCKNAILPPDDDRDDQQRICTKTNEERSLSLDHDPLHLPFSAFGPRPLPTEVPRHQTLCILLI